jgi:hypothetical protein
MIFVAVSGALYAELQKGRYQNETLGNIQQAAPPGFSVDSQYSAGAYASLPPVLPPGVGQQETASFCSICHSTRYITMQHPLPSATWEAEVNKMIHAYGAPIPEASAKKITLYLQQNFTPEARKP